MTVHRRSTIYFEPDVYRALRLHSASIDRNVSEVVNDIVRRALKADLADLALARKRRKEPRQDLETVVKDLRRRGKI